MRFYYEYVPATHDNDFLLYFLDCSERERNDTTVRVNVASGILSCSVYVDSHPFKIDPTLTVEYNKDVSFVTIYDNNVC